MTDKPANKKPPEKKLTKHGYIYEDNLYAEDLIQQIRAGGDAKVKFREIFEVNASLFIEKNFNKLNVKSNEYEKVPIKYWSANSQRMAKIMVDFILNDIERGKFDKYDQEGNIKTRNAVGKIRGAMKNRFKDLLKGNIEPLKRGFVKEIPSERKMIEFLDELAKAQNDEFTFERVEALKKKQIKKLRAIETVSQFSGWLKESATQQPDSPLDLIIKKSTATAREIIIKCFKTLTKTEKMYTAFGALKFLGKDVAEIFNVTRPAVSQTMSSAAARFRECLEQHEIESISELFGDRNGT
jgi:hypothetical protein